MECGRTTFFADTAANEKRQSCGRADCSFIRPQKGKRRNASVLPTLPIRPQLKKGRAAAVRISHLYGRKKGKGGMRPYYPPCRYGRKWKKTELRPCAPLSGFVQYLCGVIAGAVSRLKMGAEQRLVFSFGFSGGVSTKRTDAQENYPLCFRIIAVTGTDTRAASRSAPPAAG